MKILKRDEVDPKTGAVTELSTLNPRRPKGGRMAGYTDCRKVKRPKGSYRGSENPIAERQNELKLRANTPRALKLMPCKPFKKGARSRRIRRHTWVRI